MDGKIAHPSINHSSNKLISQQYELQQPYQSYQSYQPYQQQYQQFQQFQPFKRDKDRLSHNNVQRSELQQPIEKQLYQKLRSQTGKSSQFKNLRVIQLKNQMGNSYGNKVYKSVRRHQSQSDIYGLKGSNQHRFVNRSHVNEQIQQGNNNNMRQVCPNSPVQPHSPQDYSIPVIYSNPILTNNPPTPPYIPPNHQFIKYIGQGSFGAVYLLRKCEGRRVGSMRKVGQVRKERQGTKETESQVQKQNEGKVGQQVFKPIIHSQQLKSHQNYNNQNYVVMKVLPRGSKENHTTHNIQQPYNQTPINSNNANPSKIHPQLLLPHLLPHPFLLLPYQHYLTDTHLILLLEYADQGDLHCYINKRKEVIEKRRNEVSNGGQQTESLSQQGNPQQIIPTKYMLQWSLQLMLGLNYMHNGGNRAVGVNGGPLRGGKGSRGKNSMGRNTKNNKSTINNLNQTYQYQSNSRILHRDIKCQNILLVIQSQSYQLQQQQPLSNVPLTINTNHPLPINTNNPLPLISKTNKPIVAKLGDLGIARSLNSTMQLAKTAVGTPHTMAPQLWQNKPYNQACDLWSLGCVFYKMMKGQYPYQGTNVGAIVAKMVGGGGGSYEGDQYRGEQYQGDQYQGDQYKGDNQNNPSLTTSPHLPPYPLLPTNFPPQYILLTYQLLQIEPWKRPNLQTILNRPFWRNQMTNRVIGNAVRQVRNKVISNRNIMVRDNNNQIKYNNQIRQTQNIKQVNKNNKIQINKPNQLKILNINNNNINPISNNNVIPLTTINNNPPTTITPPTITTTTTTINPPSLIKSRSTHTPPRPPSPTFYRQSYPLLLLENQALKDQLELVRKNSNNSQIVL